jgi:hypothetical protein
MAQRTVRDNQKQYHYLGDDSRSRREDLAGEMIESTAVALPSKSLPSFFWVAKSESRAKRNTLSKGHGNVYQPSKEVPLPQNDLISSDDGCKKQK